MSKKLIYNYHFSTSEHAHCLKTCVAIRNHTPFLENEWSIENEYEDQF